MAFHTQSHGARIHAAERFADYRRAAHLISQHPTVSQCEAVRRLVTPGWYERVYVPKQPNIHLVRNKPLPGELLGLVIRRDFEWHGRCRGVFLIQVAPQPSSFAEHFVIAHELGHVLAHGSLMYAGMVISEPACDRPAEEYDRRLLVELEANICALMAVVPQQVIHALATAIDRPVDAPALQIAMQWLAGEPFDLQLARERLLLHGTLGGTGTLEDFTEVVCESERSWTLNGAAALGVFPNVSPNRYRARVSLSQLKVWLRLLCESGTVSPAQWPRVNQLLQVGSTRQDALPAPP